MAVVNEKGEAEAKAEVSASLFPRRRDCARLICCIHWALAYLPRKSLESVGLGNVLTSVPDCLEKGLASA